MLPGRGDVDLDERSGDLRLGKAATTTTITTVMAYYAIINVVTIAALLAGGGHHYHDVCVAGEQVDERRELRVAHFHALHTYTCPH